MSRTITTDLSTKDLQDMQKRVDEWAKKLDEASKGIVKDIADFGLKEMMRIYGEAQTQYQDSTPMDFSITGTEYQKNVTMSGQQAIYDEFGTGTIGERNSHPQKGEFGLNPYNSGRTIRKNKSANTTASKNNIPVGELYWTYKVDGVKKYTQGIPAQKEGYDSLKSAIKEAPSIIRKRVQEAFK